MTLIAQPHELSLMYDTGGPYLYRIFWSSERGYHTLQRRLKPVNPNSFALLWTRSMIVENYIQLNEFDPSPHARPIMKFDTRQDAERIIQDDSVISGIIPKRKVEPR